MSTPKQFDPPPKSGGGGAIVVIIVIVVVLVLMLGCGGLCAGLLFYGASQVDSAAQQLDALNQFQPQQPSPPVVQPGVNDWWTTRSLAPVYPAALDAVAANPAVKERLGEPIEPTGESDALFRRENEGALQTAGETILFDIKGPKGTAVVSVLAKPNSAGSAGGVGMPGDTFRAAEITVKFSDKSTIMVPAPKEQAGTQIQ